MKRNPLSGAGKVYAFSLKNTCFSKGWLISTLVMAALLLFGIPLLCWGISAAASSDKKKSDDQIKTVAVVDETEGEADYNTLKESGYPDVNYLAAESVEAAAEQLKGQAYSVILHVAKSEESYALTVYLPEDTEVSRSKGSSYAEFVSDHFSALLMQKAALDADTVSLLQQHISTDTAELKHEGGENADEDEDTLQEVMEILMPFMMMMLIYMMVIFYGQSMSNSVMLEKTSKLMETMLTAVHPVALLTGKLFATATAAIIQLLLWMASALLGTLMGVLFLIKMVVSGGLDSLPGAGSTPPGMEEAMTQMMQGEGAALHPAGLLPALLMLALGFLLYLSLSGLAGALASKTEDLNKTNIIFVFVLLGSMMLCMNFNGGDEDSILSQAAWLNYFPFTSLLLVPGKLLMGTVSAGTALLSLVIMALSVALFVWIAAAVYKLLVLYRGAPPSPASLIQMLKENRSRKGE